MIITYTTTVRFLYKLKTQQFTTRHPTTTSALRLPLPHHHWIPTKSSQPKPPPPSASLVATNHHNSLSSSSNHHHNTTIASQIKNSDQTTNHRQHIQKPAPEVVVRHEVVVASGNIQFLD
ncbi:hypothetical protein QVD17_01034 [Tagetes erecta]|uniref:Uncharacterized protein n=1 Tax=Tagetes erecta TaxID=13708 RepID=A0AAD8P6E4_TARER|nr:hypothetical protein QVD17_01034 [Tagetes erecta]